MALVDDDEIEEVRRILAEIGRRLAVLRRTAHEVWKIVKNRLPFFGTLPFLRMSSGSMRTSASSGNAERRRCRPGRRGCCGRRGTECAGGAIGSRLRVPAAVEEFPCDLKGDEGLAGAGGEREQDACSVVGDGLQHALDGNVLVVADLDVAALVLERHGGEAVAPCVRLGERQVPEFIRRRVIARLAFLAGLHVDAVDALAVGGSRRSGLPSCRRSSWPAPRLRSVVRPTPWPRRPRAWCCDTPARNRR